MQARLGALAYRTQIHQIGNWSVERAAATLAWGTPAVILLLWFLRGRPMVSWPHWLVIALVTLAALGLSVLAIWSRRRQFMDFELEADVLPPAPLPLDPHDKVLTHVTGWFEVAGKRHVFANLLAYWRSFATREHAVMAIVHSTRFLGIAKIPEEHVGMWYIFFRSDMIDSIEPGTTRFGEDASEGLRIRYWRKPETEDDRRRRRTKPILETIFLSFSTATERQQIWADLLAD